MSNVEVVKHRYERFAKVDGAAILATFDPQVEFRLSEGHHIRQREKRGSAVMPL